jgi:hypothetical protein
MYVDMDDGPGDRLRAKIEPFSDAQAIVLQNTGNIIVQSFFMVAPRHPLMHFALLESTLNLLLLKDVNAQYIPYTTGPEALGKAYHKFMGVYGENPPDIPGNDFWRCGYYVGHGGWSVNVVAKRKVDMLKLWLVDKDHRKEYYAAVNGKDYERRRKVAYLGDDSDRRSCFAKIYDAWASNGA